MSRQVLILEEDLQVFGKNIWKLFKAKWRLLMSMGMKMDENILITMTDPKDVGKSLTTRGPPMSCNMRIDNPRSFIMSRYLNSILMIASKLSLIFLHFSFLVIQAPLVLWLRKNSPLALYLL